MPLRPILQGEAVAKFQKRDAVQFRTGGPKMIVDEVLFQAINIDDKGRYKCRWFDGSRLNTAHFHEDDLVAAGGSPSAATATRRQAREKFARLSLLPVPNQMHEASPLLHSVSTIISGPPDAN